MSGDSKLSTIQRELYTASSCSAVSIAELVERAYTVAPEFVKAAPIIGKLVDSAIGLVNAKNAYSNIKAGILLHKISEFSDRPDEFRELINTTVLPLSGAKDAILKAVESVQEIDDETLLSSLALLAANYRNKSMPVDIFFNSMCSILKCIHIDEYYWFRKILLDLDSLHVDIKQIGLFDSGTSEFMKIEYWDQVNTQHAPSSYFTPITKSRSIHDIRRNLVLAFQQPGIMSQTTLRGPIEAYTLIDSHVLANLRPYFV